MIDRKWEPRATLVAVGGLVALTVALVVAFDMSPRFEAWREEMRLRDVNGRYRVTLVSAYCGDAAFERVRDTIGAQPDMVVSIRLHSDGSVSSFDAFFTSNMIEEDREPKWDGVTFEVPYDANSFEATVALFDADAFSSEVVGTKDVLGLPHHDFPLDGQLDLGDGSYVIFKAEKLPKE